MIGSEVPSEHKTLDTISLKALTDTFNGRKPHGIEASYRRINAAEWDESHRLVESYDTLAGEDRYEAYASIADSSELRTRAMSVHDYLIDHNDFDWAQLLSGWAWQLRSEFTVWLMNRFGDLFFILPDGSVNMLDFGDGSLTKMAESRDDFSRRIDEDDNADDWLMIPLVDRLVAAGIHLQSGQWYSLLVPPILGGDYTVENTVVLPIAEHYGVYGSYHEQLRGIPDGTKVVIKVKKPPPSEPESGCLDS